MRQAAHTSHEQKVKFPKAVTKEVVQKVLQKLKGQDNKTLKTKIVVMLSWITAARVGCVLSLQKHNIKFERPR